jgi:Domain of unknown function (DUF4129)
MSAAQRSKRWNVAGATACGLGALVAVVALASRVPLDGSTPVNASSARTPLTALFVLVAGAGAIALGAMTLLLRPRRRRGDDEPERKPPALDVHWAWKVAAILIPFALGSALVAAAVLGARITPAPARPRVALPTHTGVAPPTPEPGARSFALPSWLPWTLLGILAVAALVGGWLLLRRSRTPTDEAPSTPTARAAVEAAISALDSTPDPRAAVIAAYAAMERTFAAHDLGRRRPEAPREYLRRVLRASEAPADQAVTITGQFEEARFSTHPISEHARVRTLAALSSLRDSLGGDSGR